MSTISRKRRDISHSEEALILDQMNLQPPGTSQRRLSELLRVTNSTVAKIAYQEASLREMWRKDGKGRKAVRNENELEKE